jgi:GTP-binding protein
VNLKEIIDARFVTSVFDTRQLPAGNMPEIAFAGKSNVGKSSLLNSLMCRKGLVKVSSRPGFTQSLNFFLVNRAAHFVDLPGYGFARAPRKVKQKWYSLVEGYIRQRPELKAVVCILDIRRTPDRLDIDLMDYLKASSIPAVIVLNKADKISQPKRKRQLSTIKTVLPVASQPPLIVSARTGEGVAMLREKLLGMLFSE